MNIKTATTILKKQAATVDWKLLAFLMLFMDVKILAKITAVILIYLFQFNFKFNFTFKQSRLPLFYPAVIAIAIFNWIIYAGFTNLNYNLVFLLGIGFWVLCILAIHQVKLSVEQNTIYVIHKTVTLFFMVNAILSVCTLLIIILEIHSLNPYRYQGLYQKYFIGTGDYIKGITFDVSTTNAAINALGIIYFLVNKRVGMVLLCMAILLLTGSNTINLMLSGILLLLFIFKTTRDQKSVIIVCFVMLAVFMVKISPQNDGYLYKTYYKLRYHKMMKDTLIANHEIPITKRPDSILSAEERKQKSAQLYLDHIKSEQTNQSQPNTATTPALAYVVKPEIPTPSIHTKPFQHRDNLTDQQVKLITFINAHRDSLPASNQRSISITIPGKIIAAHQTFSFFQHNMLKAISGTGIGNFSSKLAFKATGLGIAGAFPAKYTYINTSFLTNHLDIYLNFFSRTAGYHSLTNNPNSVYDQLLSEYGLLGVLAFAVYYVWYFLKHYKRLTYGIPLLLFVIALFTIDYWFEQLSVIILFELLMLLNIKETALQTSGYAKN